MEKLIQIKHQNILLEDLVEEPGYLEEVSRLAKEWFNKYLNRKSR